MMPPFLRKKSPAIFQGITDMMRLYFLRHGIAYDAAPGTPDASRELTEAGIANTRDAARVLAALGFQPGVIYSSPLTRARQTAEIVAQAVGTAVEVRAEVGPGFNIAAVAALTRDLPPDAEVLFVGHEPDFSSTITALVGGRIVMKKGALARVDVITLEPLVGELMWLIAPKIFSAVSG